MNVSQALEDYCRHKDLEGRLKRSSLQDMRWDSDIISNYLGHMPVEKLHWKNVVEMLEKMDCSLKRKQNLLWPLRACYKRLVDMGALDYSPLEGKSPPGTPSEKQEIQVFSREMEKAVYDHLLLDDREAAEFWMFMLWTGLRPSEGVALRWKDVDWPSRTINVARAIVRGVEGRTKTSAGVRAVKLLSPAEGALELSKAIAEQEGIPQDHKVWRWKNVRAWYRTVKPALDFLEIDIPPRCTRHTYASRMLSAGENLTFVSRQLGHTTTAMTEKRYAKFLPDRLGDFGTKAERIYG